MKNFLSALLFIWFAGNTALQAQTKPVEKFPEFIEINPTNVALEKSTSLKTVLQRTYKMKNGDDLRMLKKESDPLGFTREKYQQFYKGLPVEGATVTAHYQSGALKLFSGNYSGIENLTTTPSINAQSALAAAIAHVGAKKYMWDDRSAAIIGYKKPTGQLVVLVDYEEQSIAKLAYKFDIYAVDPLYRAYVFIDANTGQFLREDYLIHETNAPATGTTLYNGNASFTADNTGSNFRLRQTTSGNGVETYNMSNGTTYGAATDFTSPTSNFTADAAGVQAHWSAEKTHAYYLTQHGRNSYDGAGAVLKSYVHYDVNFVNAFWNGSFMTYGDGGNGISSLVTLDICGHEITHAVTQFTAGLIYASESGALNESFSDIFGEAIENYASGSNNWLIGSEIGITIRSMSNPNAFGDPDTYQGANWRFPSGTCDNSNDQCGVHFNSGVQNKWFYLLTQGESGTNDNGNAYCVKGIGITKAAKIAYRNLTVYLSASSGFAAARIGAIKAAQDLFGVGSAEEIATTNAWFAVGVGSAYLIPVVINCPANIVVNNAAGQCSAPVTYATPAGTGTCATTSQTNGLPSGASFPVGTTTNVFRVSDGVGGTRTCSFTVQVKDAEKPSITCPPNITQSCELSTAPATTGNPGTSDNCGLGSVTNADVKTPGSCPGNYTLNRTWTVTDIHANANTCLQVIKVQDITPPAIVCPVNITVDCVTTPAQTGTATAPDNCDANPSIVFADVVTGGDCDWLCTIERTWTATDNCNNTKKCVQVITKSALPLIEAALNKDVDGDGRPDLLVMGFTNSTVTIPPGKGNCVLIWMPYSGTLPPTGLTFKKSTVGLDCLPGTNPVSATGRIENPYFGEALRLALLVRIKPSVGATKLSTLACTIDRIVLQSLKPDPDVNELLRVAQLNLGNVAAIPGGHLEPYLEALKCVNALFKFCP